MTIFEERFLKCRPGSEASGPSLLDGLALSPGPVAAPEPLFSYDVGGIEEYPEDEFLDSLASIEGVGCRRDGRDSAWAFRWSRGGRTIDLVRPPGEVFDQDGEAIWLGSRLRINCTFADLVRFWNALRAFHPAVWLFNNLCRMYTPQSFLEECALPALCRAATDADPTARAAADEAFDEYASLARVTRQHDPVWPQAARHMAASAFDLDWPVVQLVGPVPSRQVLARKVRKLDHALAEAGVQFSAYPTMLGNSQRGITVWVTASQADAARLILQRVGLTRTLDTIRIPRTIRYNSFLGSD